MKFVYTKSFSSFCITAVILYKEIMPPIQVIPCDFQSFAEPLEVDDLPFPQEAERGEYFGVIGQVDKVFISASGFLFCCTFVSVTCYVKFRMMCIMNFILNLCIAEKEIV